MWKVMTCSNYAPDYQCQGDCMNCGHTAAAHGIPEEIRAKPALLNLWAAADRLDAKARTLDRLGVAYPKR